MKRAIVTIWSLLAVAIPQAGGATSAEEATRVDTVNAARSGAVANVTGGATFVDVPVVVGTDPVGDAVVPGIGTDLTEAAIGRPDPFGDSLRFTMSVFDQPDDLGSAPEAICYQWFLEIDGSIHWVQGWRMSQVHNPGALEATFRLDRALSSVLGLLASGMPLPGRIEDGVVEFSLPLAAVAAEVGTRIISPSGWPGVQAKFSGPYCPPSDQFDADNMTVGPYVVPGPSVELGIAPVGTPPSLMPTTVEASVLSDGSFSGSLSLAGRPSGTYVVLARACYGEDNCGEATTTITI